MSLAPPSDVSLLMPLPKNTGAITDIPSAATVIRKASAIRKRHFLSSSRNRTANMREIDCPNGAASPLFPTHRHYLAAWAPRWGAAPENASPGIEYSRSGTFYHGRIICVCDYITLLEGLIRPANCTIGSMTEANDKIAQRIVRICNAKPVKTPPPLPPRCSQTRDRAERESVFHLASIYTGQDTFVRCVISDVSDAGACLTLKSFQILPQFVVVKLDSDGIRKRVRVVWQKKKTVGVVVADDQTGVDAICPPGAPVRALHG